jgi:hypothetical protein
MTLWSCRIGRPGYCRVSLLAIVAIVAATTTLSIPSSAIADVKPFSTSFKARRMTVVGGTQYVRVGGSGPALVMLHGFGDTGDMWQPLADVLVTDHTVTRHKRGQIVLRVDAS